MRLALAHDYLTQRGGAERVALALAMEFADAPLYTSVYNPHGTFPEFACVDVRTSFLQSVERFRRDPRAAFPLLPAAWRQLHVQPVDVILASTTGWAHAIGKPEGARLIAYCHNPARWLYQPHEYIPSRVAQRFWEPCRRLLVRWDAQRASSVDRYIANSTSVASRIRETYGVEPEVIHPPVMVDPDAEKDPVTGIDAGYWLVVARGRGYKNVDAIIEATAGLSELVVVVGASFTGREVPTHVRTLGIVSDAQLRWLYANARALVSVSYEDFGLTPIEANAFGTPVAVLRAGGFLDSTQEGASGVFIPSPTPEAIRATLRNFPDLPAAAIRANAARFSSDSFLRQLSAILSDVASDMA
ncbi:glycosyltransferase [Geodermatophilus marinus]|uniref:glycosyltransferase n=1 Tax=Geodermatophilus sp. LHW52908 TaxID=2303986 RepID=UPI000E3DA20B|nr:glycosyltransferase [Geodermatophilus sp. LHW52908]